MINETEMTDFDRVGDAIVKFKLFRGVFVHICGSTCVVA